MNTETLTHRLLRYKKPALILFLIWTGVGLAFTGVGYLAVVTDNRQETFLSVLVSSLLRSYVWGLFSPLLCLVAVRFPIEPGRTRWKNLTNNLLFGLSFSLVYSAIFAVYAWISNERNSQAAATGAILVQRLLVSTGFTVFSLFSPTFFTIQALMFFQNYRDEKSKNLELQAVVSETKLNALKMQLHPHFLFNSLHAISSLILVDPPRANRMVALLGDFLRQTLEHSGEQIVTLEEELGFLRCYLEIEETRFEDRLSVHFDIDRETLGVPVPHLILQPIVENAVKHGVAPYALPGRIVISAKKVGGELILRVTDSGPNGNKVMASDVNKKNGVGIANVLLRLNYIYGARASLKISEQSLGGCQVDLRIPIIADLIAD